MWLAIDFGNTRLKWAKVNNGNDIIAHGVYEKYDISKITDLTNDITDIWISHVGSYEQRQHLQTLLVNNHKTIHFITSQKKLAGLDNHYCPPTALGVDRWLCLLAMHPTSKPVIIVSAGTAITIDLLTEKACFRGGLIIPGLSLMGNALSKATDLRFTPTAATKKLPDNTDSAIATGIMFAATGAILSYRQQHCPQATLYLTGGEAKILHPWLDDAIYKPNLVLLGIIRHRQIMRQ